jgi:hypothetical protein
MYQDVQINLNLNRAHWPGKIETEHRSGIENCIGVDSIGTTDQIKLRKTTNPINRALLKRPTPLCVPATAGGGPSLQTDSSIAWS